MRDSASSMASKRPIGTLNCLRMRAYAPTKRDACLPAAVAVVAVAAVEAAAALAFLWDAPVSRGLLLANAAFVGAALIGLLVLHVVGFLVY